MLLTFTVDNFKSFNSLNTLSMFKGNVLKKKDHLMKIGNSDILKGAVIYGSNGGGKTSFIDAIMVSQRMIITDLTTESFNHLPEMYCRISQENKTRPTLFEYIFETEGKCYRYTLHAVLSERKIISEILSECNLETSTFKTIFVRDDSAENRFDFESGGFFSPEEVSKLKDSTQDLDDTDHTTLLTLLTFKKKYNPDSQLHVFNRVMKWFLTKLHVNTFPIITKEQSLAYAELLSHFISDFKNAEYVLSTDVPKNILNQTEKFLDKDERKSVVMKGICFEKNEGTITSYIMKIHHDSTEEGFDIFEESGGTLQTLDYSFLLSDAYKDNTYIIDEFGSKMHPVLAKHFIDLFYASHIDDNIQLIIATHHTSLMTLDLYRSDEIWFIDKNNGESELYSLQEFQPRSDVVVDKNYYSGRYGALPVFDEW